GNVPFLLRVPDMKIAPDGTTDPAGNDGLLAAATRRADGSATAGSDAWWDRLFGELRSVAEAAPAERRKEGVVALASARADATAERGTDEWWQAVFAAVRQLDGIDGAAQERINASIAEPVHEVAEE